MEKIYMILLLFVFFALLYLSWQDIKTQKISREITLVILISVFLFNVVDFVIFENFKGYDSLLGGLVLGVVFLSVLLITKEKSLGFGDVYLLMLLGLLVGFQNIFFALSILVITSFSFSFFKFKKLNLKQKIPLVPFISLSIFLVLILEFLLL